MSESDFRNEEFCMYRAILALQSVEECKEFFEDICSINELNSIEQRFEVARMLNDKKVYTEIMQATRASSATISRVNRMLKYGTGCLGRVLNRLRENETGIKE